MPSLQSCLTQPITTSIEALSSTHGAASEHAINKSKSRAGHASSQALIPARTRQPSVSRRQTLRGPGVQGLASTWLRESKEVPKPNTSKNHVITLCLRRWGGEQGEETLGRGAQGNSQHHRQREKPLKTSIKGSSPVF